MEINDYSDKDLGLDGVGQVCDEHDVYLFIINNILTTGDIRTELNYVKFMNWLIKLDFIGKIKNDAVIENILGWQKSMRPELCKLATDADRCNRKAFDPVAYFESNLAIHKNRHSSMKQYILESIITEAPKEFVVHLFKEWINDKEISEWLFTQNYYPLSMLMDEYCPWNLLLYGLPKILPETDGHIKSQFKECDGKNETVQISQEDNRKWVAGWSDSFGRTLIKKTKTTRNEYLKIQSDTESDDEFKKGYARLKLTQKLGHQLNIESLIPEPKRIMHIMKPHSLILSATTHFNSLYRETMFLSMVNKKPRLAMEFTTPSDVPYEKYCYDVIDELSSLVSLSKYARDYGKLWREGLLPPSCLSAFHDKKSGRKHRMLSAFFGNRRCEGSIEDWDREATDYPNIGDGKMGMRDKVDISLPEEKMDSYLKDFTISTAPFSKLHCHNIDNSHL